MVDREIVGRWVRICLFYLILVGLLGLFLRWVKINPIQGVNYKFFLHTHSHIAFLGWAFNAFYVAIVSTYLSDSANFKFYRNLFWTFQATVLGMGLTFPFQGYGSLSITFSTIHILLSFWFVLQFWKDAEPAFSLGFIKLGLLFMVLSSLGPFTLGIIMAKGLAQTDLYDLALYFYLHFQYNGWFILVAFGLFFRILEKKKVQFPQSLANWFLWGLGISCLLTFSLSALWLHPPMGVYLLGFISALIQMAALCFFLVLLNQTRTSFQEIFSPWVRYLFSMVLIAFSIKLILQLLSVFPEILELAVNNRLFLIGYLHLVFIGTITLFLIGWFIQLKWVYVIALIPKGGLIIFLSGFLGSELYLVLQPALSNLVWDLPYFILLLFSAFMPLGIAILLIAQPSTGYNHQ